MKKMILLVNVLAMAAILLAACGSGATPVVTEPPATEPPAATEPPVPAWTAPDGALVSISVEAAPSLDGTADDAVWAGAPELVIEVNGGANFDDTGSTEVHIRSVYTGDSVYFLVTYADPTESFFRSPWQLQEDGTWLKITDPNDHGGDNNLAYEDKLAFIWPINNSIPNFETQGCFVACHAGENADLKPFGNKYTANEGEIADIWHWKSIRNLAQVDDQYLDSTRYSSDSVEAGRHSDPKDSGGYANNENEDKTGPAFTSPAVDPTTGAPGYILDSEKVAIDPALLTSGQYIPGIIISTIVGDRGDISAGWNYENGIWTLEFGRALVTGSEYDVQFDDLAATYYFSVAAFDNAQVRHAYQMGATPFVFEPR
ncbi:MAG: ethylbenzene dehydrogenase-related protein [Chloroflexota bacterium]